MKTIKFLEPVTVEFFMPFEDEARERTFVKGEIIKAKITRETPHVIDLSFYGDDIYGISKSSVVIL